MSQRSAKKTTTTSFTSRSGEATSSGGSASFLSTPGSAGGHQAHRSPQRAASPTMISRLQEKNDLATLNDRLAAYIDRVRQLEGENSRLTRIIQTQEDTVSREVSGIKGMYDSELAGARRLLDEMAKEKARLQIEVGKLKSELDELREKYKALEKDAAGSQKRLLAAEAQVNELQARLNDALNQRRHFEDEWAKLKKEFDSLTKAHGVSKRQLEEETIARVDLQNKLQSLKEELAFKNQVHEQELNESVHRSRVVIEEVDDRLQTDYASKLGDALRQAREENEVQLRAMREESDGLLERKLAELRAMAAHGEGATEKLQSELRSARTQIDSLNSELSGLRNRSAGADARIRDLEAQLARDADAHDATVAALNGELRRLRAQLEAQLQEYRDLMDVKIQLDTEIAAYRKLLESEESRLNLSGEGGTPGRTPGARAGADSSRKRKRVDEEEGGAGRGGSGGARVVKDSAFNSDFASKSSAKDVVEVFETSTDGSFIKLFNTSADKDVSLGGWQLHHKAGGEEMTFKFPRASVLKAGQYVTVWSSSSGQTHSPPSNYVMKGVDWHAGDEMHTTLIDGKGEEVAAREMQRSQLRTTFTAATKSSFSAHQSSFDTGSSEEESGSKKAKSSSKWGWSIFSLLS